MRDFGPGISAEDQQHVFDRFWRRPATGRRTGLGLAIVRQIAEAHGGYVRVFSTLGEGSTFVLWLAAPAAAETVAFPPTLDSVRPPDLNPLDGDAAR